MSDSNTTRTSLVAIVSSKVVFKQMTDTIECELYETSVASMARFNGKMQKTSIGVDSEFVTTITDCRHRSNERLIDLNNNFAFI